MANNSTEAGYLAAAPPKPVYDDPLEDVFHDSFVGVTGLATDMVRPRWQPDPPPTPPASADWIAFGVTITKRDWDPAQSHDPSGVGVNNVDRAEYLEVLISFYGPNRDELMARYCDGMSVTQNRDDLAALGIRLTRFGDPVNLPALLKDKWHKRVDVKGYFTRTVRRTFAVESLESASGFIDNENYRTPFDVQPPTP